MSRHFGIRFAPLSGFHGAKTAAGEHRQPRLSPAPAAVSIQAVRPGPGGAIGARASRYDAVTRAELNSLAASDGQRITRSGVGLGRILPRQEEDASFPPLPSRSILKSPNPINALAEVSPTIAVAQATIDFLKVIFALLFVAVTGAGIAASVLYFLFL
ncbi:hypothetical protein [Bradyrhizobium sp. USDA 4452]